MGMKRVLVMLAAVAVLVALVVFVRFQMKYSSERAAMELSVEAGELISRAEQTSGQSAIDLYEQGLRKFEEIVTKHSKSRPAVILISGESFYRDLSLKQLRHKVAELRRRQAALLISDPIVEEEVRGRLEKREGELTESDLAKVTGVILSNPNFTDEGLKEVAKLKQLEALYLDGTKTTDAGLKEVAKLQKLTHLFLGDTQITDEGLKEVAKLKQLEELNLYDCTKTTDTGLKEVAKLQNLERLSLALTKITDEGLKDVAKLQNLSTLGLDRTQITDAGLKEVAKLPNLKELVLGNTQITDEGLKDVAKLQKLESLNLYGTKVTKAGADELEKALPNCKILGR